jgi:hypothetical protein
MFMYEYFVTKFLYTVLNLYFLANLGDILYIMMQRYSLHVLHVVLHVIRTRSYYRKCCLIPKRSKAACTIF